MTRIASAQPSGSRPGYPQGMVCVDTSGNPRIPLLMELVGALSRAREPQQVLLTFAQGMAQLYGPRGYISLSTRGLQPGEYRITRLLREADPDALASIDSWDHVEKFPVHRDGFLGGLIRSAYPEVIHHLNVQNDPVLGDMLAGFGSLLAIPLFDDGEPLNWAINLRKEPEGFSVDELEQSILRSNLVGGTVRNTLISKELRDAHGAIQREVDQIASIQRALLPVQMPEISGVSVAASYETFDRAGGDYYDFIPLPSRADAGPDPDDRWGLLIADASGHGPAAAVVMAMLQVLLHAYPTVPHGPAEVLEHANRHLQAKRIEHSFVTALFGIYDPPTRRFTYARAGQNPPVWMRRRGEAWDMTRLDEVGGLPLAVVDCVKYDEATIELESGQSLVFYTDGIVEAMSPDGRMFGVEGIERSLTECTGEPDCVISHVTKSLKEHEATIRPRDDQTLVVMRVR